MSAFQALSSFYDKFLSFCEILQNVLLLLIRLWWGYLFFMSGLGKIEHITSVTDFFTRLQMPWPLLMAYVTAWIELIGGAMLIAGFLTRLAAIPLAITMVIAYLTSELDSILHIFRDPSEFTSASPFPFLLATLLLLAFGPGIFSIDALLEKYFGKRKRG